MTLEPQGPDTARNVDTAGSPAAESVDATSFLPRLDARQRAMLAEMGVRVWAPKALAAMAPAPAPSSVPVSLPGPAATQHPAHQAAPSAQPVQAAQPGASAVAARARAPLAPVAPVVAPDAPASVALAGSLLGVDTMDWATLRATVADCRACGLCEGRTHTVFGTGAEQADWMVVGEAPGELEDRQGDPYLGDAGRLLDNMLRAVGRSRTGQGDQAAYVAHVLKCRPPSSRNPQAAEIALCAQYLARQVALVQPKVIVALGPLAAQALLQSQEPIGRLRGQVHRHQGVPVIVTFPPSHLLRTPANKAKAWADLCLALEQVRPAR